MMKSASGQSVDYPHPNPSPVGTGDGDYIRYVGVIPNEFEQCKKDFSLPSK